MADDSAAPEVAMDRALANVHPQKQPDLGEEDQLVDLRLTMDVRKAELDLLYTSNEATSEHSPLARFTIGKVWLALQSMASGRLALSLSVPVLQGTDLRPGLPNTHRYVCSFSGFPPISHQRAHYLSFALSLQSTILSFSLPFYSLDYFSLLYK